MITVTKHPLKEVVVEWLKRVGVVVFAILVPGGLVITIAGLLIQRYRKGRKK